MYIPPLGRKPMFGPLYQLNCPFLQCLWSIVAAILHLGNLEFKGTGHQGLASFEEPDQARTVAKVYTNYTLSPNT